MITLTETAADQLSRVMTEKGLDNYALRVFVSGGGCSGPIMSIA
jgi:Fe-S cluster assembly iron-binding protein IscA